MEWEDGEGRVGKGTCWKVRLFGRGRSANDRKLGMKEFFFVMETGTGRWGGNGREVSK